MNNLIKEIQTLKAEMLELKVKYNKLVARPSPPRMDLKPATSQALEIMQKNKERVDKIKSLIGNRKSMSSQVFRDEMAILIEPMPVWASASDAIINEMTESMQEQGYTQGIDTTTDNTVGQQVPTAYENYELNQITSKLNEVIDGIVTGLGTMAYQDADDVDITGGSIGGKNVGIMASFVPLATADVLLGTSSVLNAGYNIASVTLTSTGNYAFVFEDPLADEDLPYMVLIQTRSNETPWPTFHTPISVSLTTTGFTILIDEITKPAGLEQAACLNLATNQGCELTILVLRIVPTLSSIPQKR